MVISWRLFSILGAGHLSTDCKALLGGQAYLDQLNANPGERAKMDSEYTALMAELGVGGSQGLPPGMVLVLNGI